MSTPELELEPASSSASASSSSSSPLRRTPLNAEAKELVCKFVTWWENYNPKPYLRSCATRRVGKILGISDRAIYKYFKEQRERGKFITPKKTKKKSLKIKRYDDTFYEEVVRSTIYDFHICEKKSPSIENLSPILREKINFQGKRENVRLMLKNLGFQNYKMPENKTIWKEKLEVVNRRTNYLKKIMQYRLQGRPVVYTDETYIYTSSNDSVISQSNNSVKPSSKDSSKYVIVHAGTEDGFIADAFLICKLGWTRRSEMDFDQYHNWVSKLLIPNLERNSVVVIDNKKYHNRSSQNIPKPNTTKEEMKNWLKKKDIAFPENCLKAELYDLVLKNKPQNQSYKIDDLLEQHGHAVLRLPPLHPELNSLRKFGALIKNYVTSHNENFDIEKLKGLVVEITNNINHEWRNICQHVKQCEQEYRQKDVTMDQLYESYPIMKSRYNDSSTSDDEYF